MAKLPERVIGSAYTESRAWDVLEELTAIGNRMAGQAGERRGAEVIATEFTDLGLSDVSTTTFDVPGWWRGEAALTVEGHYTRTFDFDNQIIGLPGTPEGEVDGPIVDVGYGLPEDFRGASLEGALVLASSWIPEGYDRWVHRNEKYSRAVRADAAAFLFHNSEPGCLPTTGYVGFAAGGPGTIPAAGLSYEVGTRVRRLCDQDEVTGRLSIACRNEPATSQNVEAVLGPPTADEIVLSAHHDSHDIAEGAGDNGCGSALVVEVGRLLALVEERLESRIRLVTFGAEEAGMYGSDHWAATHDLARVKCVVNLDGIGDDSSLEVNSNGFDDAADAFAGLTDDITIPVATEVDVHPHGDHWSFARRGVPTIWVGSGGSGRFSYAHTHADTLDKIDERDLQDLAVGIAAGVLELAESEVTHRPPETIRDTMKPGYEEGLTIEGRWPWGG